MDVRNAFITFYAVFWAALLAPMGKFSTFGINELVNGDKEAACKNTLRFVVAIAILNLCPAIWLFLLLEHVVPTGMSFVKFVAHVLAALSVFGFGDFGYALFGAKPCIYWFYPKDKVHDMEERGILEVVRSKHLMYLGVFYIIFFPMLAMLLMSLAHY